MTIDQKFIDKFVNVTSKAALASHHLIGKKDKISADKAAVDSMRYELNKLSIRGKIFLATRSGEASKIGWYRAA